MAITKIGNNDFEQSAPETWFPDGWGLDRLVVPFQGSVENENAFLDSLVMWEPSDIDGNMFLAGYSSDKHEHWPTVELVYIGKRGGNLPPTQHDSNDAVQSASSSRSNTGLVAASPLTAEYYAPFNQISYITRDAPGTTEADTPTKDIQVRTLTIGDTTLATGGVVQGLINAFFTIQITSTIESKEIVPGEYWQNIARKTKSLSPYIFDLPSGAVLVLADSGTGYATGDTVVVAGGGGTAVLTGIQVGIAGSITGWTVSSNTCSTAQNLVPASGGSGSGAKFNIVIVP